MSSAQRTAREQAIYDSLVYPGTNVLRNKHGIIDQVALDKIEARAVALREPTRPAFKKFTLQEMQAVHKHLLGGVYDWAGQVRTYTTGRSDVASFARPEHIESYFESQILKPLQREAFLKGTTQEQFAERAAHFASEINAVHPFIDGNGRTTRLFLKDLAFQAGHQLDIVRIEANKGAWYEAMKEGFERADTSKLQKEILNALSGPERTFDYQWHQSTEKIDRIVKDLQSKPLPGGLAAIVERADPQASKPYHGKIIAATEHHALQQVGANKFVIHDRSKGAAQTLTVGKCATIAYGHVKDMPAPQAKDKGLQR